MKLYFIFFATSVLWTCNKSNYRLPPKYQLVFNEEFNYSGQPDSLKWDYDVGGHGWGNNELQYYTSKRLNNARVENGKLIIEAHKEVIENNNYSSARIVSRDKVKWKYGKFEIKAKLPKGIGSWPAIWMLANTKPFSWPKDGEIDIMEHVGFDQGVIHGSVHCQKYYHIIGTQKTNKIEGVNCSDQFHIYQLEWDKDNVRVGMDGKYFFHFKNENSGYEAWPFDNEMYLIFNIAVGGFWGGQKGIDDNIFPLKMEIDYVKVWQKL